MNCKLANIEYFLPGKIVTNADLLKENPSWHIEALVEKTGVLSRHISEDGQTALDLAYEACSKLFAAGAINKDEVGALIFCTQSPDYLLPGNASILHGKLGLSDGAWAFDINLACSGYIYGLALARSLLNTYSWDNVLLVASDTYSKYIHPKDRSVRLLFGDGAAVTLIRKAERGIIDVNIGTFGKKYDKFIIPAGGCRIPGSRETKKEITDNSGNIRTQENIFMEGFSLLSLAMAKVPENIRSILDANKLRVEDIDLFIFHQASKAILDVLAGSLQIPEEKVFSNISSIGNIVSASIPAAIKDALNEDRIRRGDKILLCGFGAGFSWGSIILEWQ